eukprot:3994456-Amphidinium_carterae.1
MPGEWIVLKGHFDLILEQFCLKTVVPLVNSVEGASYHCQTWQNRLWLGMAPKQTGSWYSIIKCFPFEAFIKSHVARLPLEEWIDINSHLLARVMPMKDL